MLGGLWVLLHIAAQSLHVSTRRHQIDPHRNGGSGRGQEPSPCGLMRPELKPVSRDQCEGMLHSLPAQQLTCVLGAFVPAQLSDGLSLALRPPPTPPHPTSAEDKALAGAQARSVWEGQLSSTAQISPCVPSIQRVACGHPLCGQTGVMGRGWGRGMC